MNTLKSTLELIEFLKGKEPEIKLIVSELDSKSESIIAKLERTFQISPGHYSLMMNRLVKDGLLQDCHTGSPPRYSYSSPLSREVLLSLIDGGDK